MIVKAAAMKVRISPRKVGIVASLVRGRSVNDALVILANTPRKSAKPIIKLVESAKANADINNKMRPDTLKIASITVSPGIRYKRMRPGAQGRGLPFQRRTSHIYIELDGEKRLVKKPTSKKENTEIKND